MTREQIAVQLHESLNRLAKWRSLFAAWQLGTRSNTDPECAAVKDHREITILMRAELNGLVGLLVEKGVFTQEEFNEQMIEEAEHLNKVYSQRWPGAAATDMGMSYGPEAAEWMKGFPK
jgi:hypothetical protein